MRARIAPLLTALVTALLLAGCSDEGEAGPSPDQYADYLLARDQARRLVPELAAAVSEALDGYVDTLSARPDGCRSRGEETTAYEYAVTATIVSTRPDPDLATVVRVLAAHGWTVTETPRPDDARQRVSATRPGLSVGIQEGDPVSRLVLRSGGTCFAVTRPDRDAVLDLEEDLPALTR